MLRERQWSLALLGSQQGEPPNEMFNLFLGVDNSSLVTASWGPATLTLTVSPAISGDVLCGSLPAPLLQAASALTFSKTPAVAGQLDGSWHTHMGELLSSTSHTLPCLQWWFWQGSGRGQGAKSELAPSSSPTSCPRASQHG